MLRVHAIMRSSRKEERGGVLHTDFTLKKTPNLDGKSPQLCQWDKHDDVKTVQLGITEKAWEGFSNF